MAHGDGIWETDPPEDSCMHTNGAGARTASASALDRLEMTISAEGRRGEEKRGVEVLTEEDFKGHRNSTEK